LIVNVASFAWRAEMDGRVGANRSRLLKIGGILVISLLLIGGCIVAVSLMRGGESLLTGYLYERAMNRAKGDFWNLNREVSLQLPHFNDSQPMFASGKGSTLYSSPKPEVLEMHYVSNSTPS
jgi:hypothetical protein